MGDARIYRMSNRAFAGLRSFAAAAGRAALPVLLALAALLEARRACDLAGADPWRAATPAERGWRAWSDRYPGLDARLEALAAGLAPGEAIALVVPDGSDLAVWWRTRVLYALPRQPLAAVVEARAARELPRALPRLYVDAEGEVALIRARSGAHGGR